MERPITESAWQRAKHDTRRVRHSGWFFWLWEGAGLGVLGAVGAWSGYLLTPQNAAKDTAFIFPLVGGVLGAVVGLALVFVFIFLWNLSRAPYRQRGEARGMVQARPKPVPLENRLELRRAVSSVEGTTLELVQRWGAANEMGSYVVGTDVLAEADEAFARWNDSLNELRSQYRTAGEAYEPPCVRLTAFVAWQVAFISGQAKLPEGDRPSVMGGIREFADELEREGREALNGIDEIAGLLARN